MEEQDRRVPHPFGARGADVILAEHFEHGCPGDARDQGDVDAAQGDGGQDQIVQPWTDAARERGVALDGEHGARHPVGGPLSEHAAHQVGNAQPIEREYVGHQVADHEHRDREAEDGEYHDEPVDPGAVLPGGEDAHGDGEPDGDDQRQDHQRDGRLETLLDHRGDRQVGEDRGAEVAPEYVPEPFEEANEERAVEPEANADPLDVGGARLVAGDDGGRVAGGEVEKAEHEQGHDRHHRDGREDAAPDIAQHQVLVTSQNTGNGALTTPETFFRQD